MPACLPVCYLNIHRNIKICRNTVLRVYFMFVRKFLSAIEGRTWAKGVGDLGAEQDIEIKGEEVTGDW